MKSVITKMTTIFDTISEEISGTETKGILKVIKVIVTSNTIAETITNFLKTRLIYSFKCFF